MENALLARVNDLSRALELLAARQDELEARFDSVPKLAEMLVMHEDQLREQESGEDLVG